MPFALTIPAIVSFLILAAHFLHADSVLLAAPALLCPLLLLLRRRGSIRILQILLAVSAVEFLATIPASMARAHHPPVAAAILLTVVALNILAVILLNTRPVLRAYPTD